MIAWNNSFFDWFFIYVRRFAIRARAPRTRNANTEESSTDSYKLELVFITIMRTSGNVLRHRGLHKECGLFDGVQEVIF